MSRPSFEAADQRIQFRPVSPIGVIVAQTAQYAAPACRDEPLSRFVRWSRAPRTLRAAYDPSSLGGPPSLSDCLLLPLLIGMTSRFLSPSASTAIPQGRPSALLLGLALLGVASCATGRYDSSSTDGFDLDSDGNASLESGATGLQSGAQAAAGTVALSPLEDSRRTGMAFPTGDKRTSAVMLEKEMPTEVILGVPFEYRIMVENLTDSALSTVQVSDEIPGTLTVKSTEPAAEVAGGVATWDLGVLPARSTKTLVVMAEASTAGSVATCASVEYASSLCAATSVVAPALQLALSAPEVGIACDTFDLTVSVTNAGTGDARDVLVVDELPEGLTTLTGQSRIEMEFGTLASAQSKEKTIALKAMGPGTYTHAARAEAKGGLEASAAPVQTVLRAPALTLSMQANERVTAGRPIETVLTVANTGNAVSSDTKVMVNLPKGTKVSSSSDGAVENSQDVSWDLGALEPGEKRTLNVGLLSGMSGTIVSEAKASGYCADEVIATARTEVRGLPALLLEVVDESDLIVVGEPVTYNISITNQGSAPDMNVRITCDVEDGIEIVNAGGDAQATVNGKTVTFAEIATLAPGEEVSMKVTVKSSRELNSQFKVSLTSADMTRAVVENEPTRFVN